MSDPNLDRLNCLPAEEALVELEKCCGAQSWYTTMAARRPFATRAGLFAGADEIWWSLSPEDWLEAFQHHPKIGDAESLRKKFAATRQWATGEQAGVVGASEQVIQDLAAGNSAYENRFGYIFIVCATGKTAEEMLAILQERLKNSPDNELKVAAAEQAKITRIRLEKLLA